MRKGGMGMIEEGALKGRRFIIPSEVWVEKGTTSEGIGEFSQACLIHEKFIPMNGCPECQEEIKAKEEENKKIGLG